MNAAWRFYRKHIAIPLIGDILRASFYFRLQIPFLQDLARSIYYQVIQNISFCINHGRVYKISLVQSKNLQLLWYRNLLDFPLFNSMDALWLPQGYLIPTLRISYLIYPTERVCLQQDYSNCYYYSLGHHVTLVKLLCYPSWKSK